MAMGFAVLLLAAAAQASQPDTGSIAYQNARAREQSLDDQLSGATRLMRDNNMSAQGIATVVAGMKAEQREQWRIFEDRAEKDQSIRRAADAEPFDAARFEAALKSYRDDQAAAFATALNAE